MLMDLKEFMEERKVSENEIIEAGKLTNSICKSLTCEDCPFYYDDAYCLAYECERVTNVGEAVKERINALLHPSHMEKVAELLGVEFNRPFLIRSKTDYPVCCFLDDNGIRISGMTHTDTGLLEDLLTGKAYIEKEDQEND